GINTCIPGRSNRTMTVPFSATLYRRRHRVESFFDRIKRYRRVATRYDNLTQTFLGFVCLAILFTLRLTWMIYTHALQGHHVFRSSWLSTQKWRRASSFYFLAYGSILL